MAAGAFAVSLASLAPAHSEAAPICGEDHRVGQGETLATLALFSLGDSDRWRDVLNHGDNASKVEADPYAVLPAVTLRMPPCDDVAALGSSSLESADPLLAAPAPRPRAGRSEAEIAAPSGLNAVAPNAPPSASWRPARRPEDASGDLASATPSSEGGALAPVAAAATVAAANAGGAVSIVTGSNYEPFAGDGLPGGGLAVALAVAAFEAAGVTTRVSFEPDWSAHAARLLPSGRHAFTVPISMPDCAAAPEDAAQRCALVYSNPMYIVAVETYGVIGAANPPRSYDALRGASICRPVGRDVDDLLAKGLVPGRDVTLVRGADAEDCFARLLDGSVEHVSLNRFAGQRIIAAQGLAERVVALPGLSSGRMLRLAAFGGDPRSSGALMASFNEGLDTLRRTGQHQGIVNTHLTLFRTAQP